MRTLDLKKEYKQLYNASAKKPELVQVPRLQFLMIDGAIEPGMAPGTSPGFSEAVQALYGTAYTMKFAAKQRKEDPLDYPVMALEGLWWVSDDHFDIQIKDNWIYTVMIMQPEEVTAEMFAGALAVQRKKKGDLPAFASLRLEYFEEGLAVQMLHLGPYIEEPATVEKMDVLIREHGYQKTGRHHEIYLNDPLRTAPDKVKTILRHPVKA